jgi:hypothetical protein
VHGTCRHSTVAEGKVTLIAAIEPVTASAIQVGMALAGARPGGNSFAETVLSLQQSVSTPTEHSSDHLEAATGLTANSTPGTLLPSPTKGQAKNESRNDSTAASVAAVSLSVPLPMDLLGNPPLAEVAPQPIFPKLTTAASGVAQSAKSAPVVEKNLLNTPYLNSTAPLPAENPSVTALDGGTLATESTNSTIETPVFPDFRTGVVPAEAQKSSISTITLLDARAPLTQSGANENPARFSKAVAEQTNTPASSVPNVSAETPVSGQAQQLSPSDPTSILAAPSSSISRSTTTAEPLIASIFSFSSQDSGGTSTGSGQPSQADGQAPSPTPLLAVDAGAVIQRPPVPQATAVQASSNSTVESVAGTQIASSQNLAAAENVNVRKNEIPAQLLVSQSWTALKTATDVGRGSFNGISSAPSFPFTIPAAASSDPPAPPPLTQPPSSSPNFFDGGSGNIHRSAGSGQNLNSPSPTIVQSNGPQYVPAQNAGSIAEGTATNNATTRPAARSNSNISPPAAAPATDSGALAAPLQAVAGSVTGTTLNAGVQREPRAATGDLPAVAREAAAAHAASDPPAVPAATPVQMAQLINRVGQSELHIGMTTTAFGSVEVHTVVRASDIGLMIGSERGDLHSLLANEMPGILNILHQQNLRLQNVSFEGGFSSSAGDFSGGNSQPRSHPFYAPTGSSAIPDTKVNDFNEPPLLRIGSGSSLSILA